MLRCSGINTGLCISLLSFTDCFVSLKDRHRLIGQDHSWLMKQIRRKRNQARSLNCVDICRPKGPCTFVEVTGR